ncbi:hypothetical protein [Psychrobacter sp. DAB_AL32B]|uniref:hypothetical protein n=1 Tax=Psychrobacter sp. DAB_AL32B TaxID=1028414 RepID=UPI000B7E4C75|nr:hypothetical protein [Psychrobacter sp. DAB_AL32B]OXL25274.1 hypothetical protein CAN34_04545 [Psychrobacter sp. DAB_AL32B]
MNTALQQINNQFIKLTCIEDGMDYIAYIRVGSVTGVLDHGSRRVIITSDRTYYTRDSFSVINNKFSMVIN